MEGTVNIQVMDKNTQKRILCYGDSNTYGTISQWKQSQFIYRRYDTQHRWTSILSENLGDECLVIEDGQPGRTTIYEDEAEPFCHYCVGIDHLANSLMTHLPIDLVILMLGTNDLHSCSPPNDANLGDGIAALIDKVREFPQCGLENICPEILIVAPIRIKKALGRLEVYPKFHAELGEHLSTQFASVYAKIAEEKHCWFLDANLYAEPDDGDGVHFTADSHIRFGMGITEKVKEILAL